MNLAMKPAFLRGLFALVIGLMSYSTTHAYLGIHESGELIPNKSYQLGFAPQLLTSKNSGINLNIFLDGTVNDSTSARVELSGGSIDFNAFASAKWIPFPDFDRQPAMGLRFGAGYARDESENILELQLAPLVSKKYDTEYGLAVPYFAIPFTFLNTKSENFVATGLTIGSEFHYNEWKNVTMGGEIALDLNKSWPYLSIFAKFPFDRAKGFGK
jgi:hypothetical protein